jgi:hypothetical protein
MADANPEPGWYLITHTSRAPECWFCRRDGRWSPHRYHAFPTDELPEGWTLGPRIADLLRDADRYRWRVISETPTEPGMVEYYHANWPSEVDCPDSPFRDERRDIGHFDGQHFREKGTDHEVFESWKEPWMLPTHWRYLPSAPDDAEIAREKQP